MPIRHGIFVDEPLEGARGLVAVAPAVIGLVVTAPAADAALFPLDRPVLIADVRAALGKIGATGTGPEALAAIADQCSPIIVLVRVAPGVAGGANTAKEATELNVIGGMVDGRFTGMQAFLAAQAELGVRPRILGAPGLDSGAVPRELEILAERLRGFTYTGCDEASDVAEAILYRVEYAAREHMLIFPDFSGGFAGKAVAVALGTRARIDEEVGPQKTISNVAVRGVSGISKDVYFDLQDPSTPAALLNQAPVTTIIRQNGYRFWGNRTCSDEPLFAFESTVRVGQLLKDMIAQGSMWASDKPLCSGLVVDMLESINAGFRRMSSPGPRQLILGGRAWFDPASNQESDLNQGRLRIDYDYTVPAPLEELGYSMRITDQYYSTLSQTG